LGVNQYWVKMCAEIEDRSLSFAQLEAHSAKKLYCEISNILSDARNERILSNKQADIPKLLQLKTINAVPKDKMEILGGERNFDRIKTIPHFERQDGCWFDFAIALKQTKTSAEVIGFNFEIRFPDNVPVRFLRFDFNLPEHDNEERGMRFHIHPGCDDFMVNAPPMSPIEILNLFLYGFDIPEKQRSS
jgi:hypothetical protein